LLSLAPAEQAPAFYRCWTRKEAYLKAKGIGLSAPLDALASPLRPVRHTRSRGAGWTPRRHRLLDVFEPAVVRGFAATIAVEWSVCTLQLNASMTRAAGRTTMTKAMRGRRRCTSWPSEPRKSTRKSMTLKRRDWPITRKRETVDEGSAPP